MFALFFWGVYNVRRECLFVGAVVTGPRPLIRWSDSTLVPRLDQIGTPRETLSEH